MGKNKYIEAPDKMWGYFSQYREHIKSNPIKKIVKGNKNFTISDESLRRPLTLEGFSSWCFENDITSNIHDYFGNKNNSYTEYSDICRAIKDIIRSDQIEGGMAGIYNPSITQRLNGLVDRVEQKVEQSGALIITGQKFAEKNNADKDRE